MMNDQDQDLVSALAEGRLSGTAAEDALARIEADPELTLEYAAQRTALALLRSGAAPRMTSIERETLHANLRTELNLAAPVAAAPPTGRRMPWWQPVFGLATAAAVVAAVVILPGTFTQEDAEVAFQEVDVALQDFDQDMDGGAFTPPETTVAAEQETTDVAGSRSADESDISVYDTDAVALEYLLRRTKGADNQDDVEQQLSSLSFSSLVDLDTREIELCKDDLANELPEGIVNVLVIGADFQGDETIVHLGFDFGDGIEDGLSFVLGNCSLVEHGPQG